MIYCSRAPSTQSSIVLTASTQNRKTLPVPAHRNLNDKAIKAVALGAIAMIGAWFGNKSLPLFILGTICLIGGGVCYYLRPKEIPVIWRPKPQRPRSPLLDDPSSPTDLEPDSQLVVLSPRDRILVGKKQQKCSV
jgi:hypothetical protein